MEMSTKCWLICVISKTKASTCRCMRISLPGLNNDKIGHGKKWKNGKMGQRAKLAKIGYIRVISACAEKRGRWENGRKKGENGCRGQNN